MSRSPITSLEELRRSYGVETPTRQPQTRPTVPTAADDGGQISSLDELRRAYGVEPQRDELPQAPQSRAARFMSQIPDPVRRTAGATVRGLAGLLEPVQLGQDAFFAAITGAADPDSTISDRLAMMEWAEYGMFGETPARPATGEEMFTHLGMRPEAAKWAGIGADLIVDPLVFGSWLRVTGKVAGASDMVKLGDQVDNMLSPVGIGRVANKQLRRSSTISDFQDARMEALMGAFRNPESTVLGIRRFGERSTRALEYALPQAQVDRLRFGSGAAAELADARRTAKASGRRVTNDTVRMLHRAQHGLGVEASENMMRQYVRGMEEQSTAFERRLADMDPTVREVVEAEVYKSVQPGDDSPGIGLLAFLGTQDNITRAFGDEATSMMSTIDEGVANLAQEAFRAVEFDIRQGADRGLIDVDEIFDVAARRVDDQLEPARQHVGEVARERALAAGMVADDAHQMEASAVRAFNGYLADTLQIDAKLGLATSGYDFVANGVRSRVVSLTGDWDRAGNIWTQVLRRGLREGQDGIDKLRGESTGIPLRRLLARDRRTVEDTMRRRQVREAAIAAEMDRIRGGNAAERSERLGRYAVQSEELANRAENLIEGTRTALNAYPTWHEQSGSRLVKAVQDATVRYRERAADVVEAAGSGAPELARFLQAESALSTAMRRYGDLMTTLSVPVRRGGRLMSARRIEEATRKLDEMPQFAVDFIDRARGEAQIISEDLAAMSSRRREYRTEYQRRLKEQQAATRAATANAERIGDEAANQVPPLRTEEADEVIGYLNLGGDQIPLMAKDTTAEDILAARLRKAGRNADLEAEAAKPITFAELFDGMADMQALPLGDFLGGLMNGHLRRTYALFADTNDFRNYLDSLRSGVIIPSSVIDDANLAQNMPGFEREAELIQQYQAHLTRGNRGQVLKKSSIATYLLNSGVKPRRVNLTLKAMAQSINPESGALQDFLNRLDRMVPQYQSMVRRRDEVLNRIGDVPQPRVTDKRFFDEVKSLRKDELELLGEISQARASLGDQINVAQRVVGRQEMFQNILDVATRRGLVRGSRYTDEFGVQYKKYADSEGVMGGFSGKYIHPYLFEELRRASAVSKQRMPYALTRARALITGGYLAAPSVITANFFGGLYQGATVGINPATMIRRMIEVGPDVNRASLGYRDNIASELGRHIDMDVSSLKYQDFQKELEQVRLDDFGLGPEGIHRVFDDLTQRYERFLNRPGIGKYRTRFAGLEGFQFVENWFKVATYKEMLNKIPAQRAREGLEPLSEAMLQKQAAEFARTVVFDYSELPKALDALKQTGLVLFPGFSYFLAGRTIDALMNRPGSLAVADRLSEAAMNASLDVEDQIALAQGMDPWLQQDQGVPMPFSFRTGRRGEGVVDVVPGNQLIPTGTLIGGANPWGESIVGGGLWGPFFEIYRALTTDEGEAVLSGKYGNQVFDVDSDTALEKALDIFRFSYNTMAPSNIRKLITVDMEGQLAGLLPALPEMMGSLSSFGTETMMDQAYSFEEHRRRRPDQTWMSEIVRTFLRSPQTIATDGQLSGVRRMLQNEQRDLNAQITELRKNMNRARSNGEEEQAAAIEEDIRARGEEFNETWRPFLDWYRQYERRQIQERDRGERPE